MNPPLPGFGRPCWQSRLRTEAAVHPDYTDLTPWYRSETTDIVYDDVSSTFTAELIKSGYLDGTTWRGKTPTYGIEVKSTEGDCDRAFFVSLGQQKLVSAFDRAT